MATRVSICAVAAFTAAAVTGCSGSGTAGTSSPSATSTPATRVGPPLPVPFPADLSGRLARGHGNVRVLQASRQEPMGSTVALLPVPGIGTLHVHCTARPTTDFVLTDWAKGEGPPLVQHVHTTLRHPVSLASLDQLAVPPRAASGPGPEAYDQWQAAVFSEAFSATATVWSVALPRGNHCDMSAQAVLVSHGAFLRYAPRHG